MLPKQRIFNAAKNKTEKSRPNKQSENAEKNIYGKVLLEIIYYLYHTKTKKKEEIHTGLKCSITLS